MYWICRRDSMLRERAACSSGLSPSRMLPTQSLWSPAIERAVAVLGIPRAEFTAEPLIEFVRRYELRTGGQAVLASSGAAHAPAWAAP